MQYDRGASTVTVSAGEANDWRQYDPRSGLDVLRRLIDEARHDKIGIEVTRPVGLTSHVGDLLRDAGVPARFVYGADAASSCG